MVNTNTTEHCQHSQWNTAAPSNKNVCNDMIPPKSSSTPFDSNVDIEANSEKLDHNLEFVDCNNNNELEFKPDIHQPPPTTKETQRSTKCTQQPTNHLQSWVDTKVEVPIKSPPSESNIQNPTSRSMKTSDPANKLQHFDTPTAEHTRNKMIKTNTTNCGVLAPVIVERSSYNQPPRPDLISPSQGNKRQQEEPMTSASMHRHSPPTEVVDCNGERTVVVNTGPSTDDEEYVHTISRLLNGIPECQDKTQLKFEIYHNIQMVKHFIESKRHQGVNSGYQMYAHYPTSLMMANPQQEMYMGGGFSPHAIPAHDMQYGSTYRAPPAKRGRRPSKASN
uniref:Uncharacterized protein n=1 Tax=Clytia hemisphaerica TaxID=252671 RepID=A0A7M5U9T3_9CNID